MLYTHVFLISIFMSFVVVIGTALQAIFSSHHVTGVFNSMLAATTRIQHLNQVGQKCNRFNEKNSRKIFKRVIVKYETIFYILYTYISYTRVYALIKIYVSFNL